MHFPILDRFLISLDSQALHSLVAPSHADEQPPNTTGHVTHLEQLPDHMSNPIQRPIVFRISMSVGTFQQFPFQFFDLLFRQVRFFPRSSPALLLRMLRFLSPATDTAFGGSQLSGNLLERFTTFQQTQSFLASLRKLFRCTRWSHAPIILLSAHPGRFYVKTQ
jgi:hypothetical protein